MVNKELIIDDRGKKYLLNKNLDNFGNDLGVVDLVGKEEGSILITRILFRNSNNSRYY